jgi:hypothetical protein
MRTLKMFGVAIAFLLFISAVALAQIRSASTPTYDAVKDFSTQSNPNGVWSYGYLTSWGAPLTLYTWGGTCSSTPAMSWWFISSCSGPPTVAHNDTDKQICSTTWCDPITYLLLHPGPKGELSVLRWTAPYSGWFLLQVSFMGLDYVGPTSTYVHILLNSKRSLLKAPITSYQWPLLFQTKNLYFSAGDTIDFIVDDGKDGNWQYDSTGAEVRIWSSGQH